MPLGSPGKRPTFPGRRLPGRVEARLRVRAAGFSMASLATATGTQGGSARVSYAKAP